MMGARTQKARATSKGRRTHLRQPPRQTQRGCHARDHALPRRRDHGHTSLQYRTARQVTPLALVARKQSSASSTRTEQSTDEHTMLGFAASLRLTQSIPLPQTLSLSHTIPQTPSLSHTHIPHTHPKHVSGRRMRIHEGGVEEEVRYRCCPRTCKTHKYTHARQVPTVIGG